MTARLGRPPLLPSVWDHALAGPPCGGVGRGCSTKPSCVSPPWPCREEGGHCGGWAGSGSSHDGGHCQRALEGGGGLARVPVQTWGSVFVVLSRGGSPSRGGVCWECPVQRLGCQPTLPPRAVVLNFSCVSIPWWSVRTEGLSSCRRGTHVPSPPFWETDENLLVRRKHSREWVPFCILFLVATFLAVYSSQCSRLSLSNCGRCPLQVIGSVVVSNPHVS